jgi:hypothetical protein
VRRFLGALPPSKKEAVSQAISEVVALPRPFGTNIEVADHPPGLGTLAVISNEAGWLIGKVPADVTDTRNHWVDIGFVLQEAVIRPTQHGIATVWIAGTFSSSLAEQSTPGFKVPLQSQRALAHRTRSGAFLMACWQQNAAPV